MLPGQGAVLPLDVARLCDVARLGACLWDSDSRAVSEPVFGTRRAYLSRLSLRLSGPASVGSPLPPPLTSPSPPIPRPWSDARRPSAPPRAARHGPFGPSVHFSRPASRPAPAGQNPQRPGRQAGPDSGQRHQPARQRRGSPVIKALLPNRLLLCIV